MYSASVRPNLALGRYPERADERASRLERVARSIGAAMQRRRRARSGYVNEVCATIHRHGARYADLDAGSLTEAVASLRGELVTKEHAPDLIARSFALIREVSGRTLGMHHFDCQLMGGWVIFHGMLAEMCTGEGKTLTASLPAATAALSGIPVHVVTVNDYLAARDAELMRPLYAALDLSVGVITEGADPAQRRAAYACDITYCTNKQLVFDYLKDRLVLGRGSGRIQLQVDRLDRENSRHNELLLRGLCFAIVDEADSVLIDEARTPLILSRTGDGKAEKQIYVDGLMIAERLREGQDYFLDSTERTARITEEGDERIGHLGEPLGGVWSSPRRRRELIAHALTAQHLFRRDRHYLVRDDKVQIIDEYTGRVMPDRSWARGLHQMVQAKEGVEVSGRNKTLAKISYQRFFRRYLRLGGMSGTAREVAGELSTIYGLNVVPVPTHRPSQRTTMADRVYVTREEKWRAVVTEVKQRQQSGQPVLVGTRTVEDSEMLSQRLHKAGIEHTVLNAAQDAQEAEIVARAGDRGRVTVATNIAGRGTDIPVEDTALAAGGLHVIVTERFEAGRIDRQLTGRCARQGDPGSTVAILSLDDELASLYYPHALRWIVERSTMRDRPLPAWAGALPIRSCQRLLERRHARVRAELFRQDQQQTDRMAFAGRPNSAPQKRLENKTMSEQEMNLNIHSACGLIVAMLFAALDCARANELPVLDCVVEPYEVIEVSSAAEGVLERVYVERNDLVTRGQVIAELESDVEKASLAYAQLNASLSSEIKLRRASLEFDERNKQRVQELYTKNAIPLHHRDEATTDAAKSHWLLTKAEDDKRLAALEYARASAVLKRKTVRSPITGVVISRHKSAGEYIEDQAIITVAQLHPLRVEVIAPVELFGSISNGMRAEITPELAAAGPLTATVMSVDRVIDGESGTFDVRLELPNPDYAIPSGLKCEIAFTDAPAADEAGLLQPPPAAPVPAETEAVPPRRTDAADLREAAAPIDEASVDPPRVSDTADAAGSPGVSATAMNASDAIPSPDAGPPAVAGPVDEVSVDTPRMHAAADPGGSSAGSETGTTVAQATRPPAAATPTVANPEPLAASPHPVPSPPAVSADEHAAATSVASSAAPASEDPGAGADAACRIIGPFKTDTDAERLLATLDSQYLSATPVQRTEEVVHSYILASPLARDQAAKDAIAAQIDAHGVKDTALLHTGPLKDRYSFGVYTNKVVAGIKLRSLKKLGFEIDLLPRKREVARWWLEVVANTDAGTTWPVASGDTAGELVTAQCAPDSANVGGSAASIAVH